MNGVFTDLPPISAELHALDPFGFFIGYGSAIRPLGGPNQSPDPKYGFHTPYREYRPGLVVFTIMFHGLTAGSGELSINLHAFIPQNGQNASLVDATRVPLAELATGSGELTLRVNAVPGVSYAVYGYVRDLTDARAASLSITAQQFGMIENENVPLQAFEVSRFGTRTVEKPSKLVDDDAPRFQDPVSQPLTPRQLEEPAYLDRVHSLPSHIQGVERQWRSAFILQALDRYGVLQAGARGLALGDADGVLSGILTDGQCPIAVAFDPARAPRMETETLGDGPMSARAIDFADIPDDMRGFDFLWSIGAANRMDSAAAASRFIESSMLCLRPGGLAIHIFDMVVPSPLPPPEPSGAVGLLRSEIERLALTLIARTNEIGQLNFGNEDAEPLWANTAGTIPFALIARRGIPKS